jgi:hypothetical protein
MWMNSPVGPCSQMLHIKNKVTQLLTIRGLRPSKHYLPLNIIIFRRRSWRTYLHHFSGQNVNRDIWNTKEYKQSSQIIRSFISSFYKHEWTLMIFILYLYLRVEKQEWRKSDHNSAWTVRGYCSSIYKHRTQPGQNYIHVPDIYYWP